MSSRNVDRLSMLPEDMVSQILSLMPTKYSVRTSVLSKRWRCSWMLVTNLDFDNTDHPYHGTQDLIKFVDRALKFCKTSLQLFRLHISKYSVLQSIVHGWIDTVVRLNIRELDIHVYIPLELSLSLSTCKTLTKLRLDLNGSYYKLWKLPGPVNVNLPCLKTLDIVVYSNPFYNVFKLINGCPMLENLSLEVKICNSGDDYIFSIPSLKRLRLSIKYHIYKVVLQLPNLEYLYVGGYMYTGASFIMEDVSSLVEAYVSYNHILDGRLRFEILNGLNTVQSLKLKSGRVCNYNLHDPYNSLPTFLNMKHLELKDVHGYGIISQFLKNCPELNHLSVAGQFIKHTKSSWIQPKSVPVCMLKHLTTIKFLNCNGLSSEMQFLEYMLWRAEVLKTVNITWGKLCIDDEMRLCAQLLKVSRASQKCEINFSTAD